jgi:hypothetical protein
MAALIGSQFVALNANAVSATLIEQRILAQQGLSIGLATITLKSQFAAFFGVGGTLNTCTSIGGGGSLMAVSHSFPNFNIKGRVKIFFDASCTSLYMDETLKFTLVSADPLTYSLTGTAQIYSKAGKKVGTLSLPNIKLSAPSLTTLKLIGTETVTSVAANTPVLTLGLSCELPRADSITAAGPAASPLETFTRFVSVSASDDIDCVEGVAQDFPTIALSTASLTPITLQLAASGKVTFKQTSPAKLVTGAIGALSIKVAASGKVTIAGTSTPFGTDKLSGTAAELVLFPPKPTKWTIVDAAHTTTFSIQLLDDTTRNLGGSVATTGGTELAPITLDQSGTGLITYSNGVKAAISSWAISK